MSTENKWGSPEDSSFYEPSAAAEEKPSTPSAPRDVENKKPGASKAHRKDGAHAPRKSSSEKPGSSHNSKKPFPFQNNTKRNAAPKPSTTSGARPPVDNKTESSATGAGKEQMQICKYFKQQNGCKYGDKCRFIHDKSAGGAKSGETQVWRKPKSQTYAAKVGKQDHQEPENKPEVEEQPQPAAAEVTEAPAEETPVEQQEEGADQEEQQPQAVPAHFMPPMPYAMHHPYMFYPPPAYMPQGYPSAMPQAPQHDNRTALCKFFAKGSCKYGASCRYSHQIEGAFMGDMYPGFGYPHQFGGSADGGVNASPLGRKFELLLKTLSEIAPFTIDDTKGQELIERASTAITVLKDHVLSDPEEEQPSS